LLKQLLFFLFILAGYENSRAQTRGHDTSYTLEDVVITGIQTSAPKATSLHIEPYSLKALEAKSPFNLSDALAHLPGISQMSTGNAISKPVIRGLFGNRVLILLSGLRFDNQQFQDEHGMGLSQIGIDRTEIIRGPASLLYGTDAVGGVINVIEDIPAAQQGKLLDAHVRLYSNTLGTLTDIGLSNRQKTLWWRLRGGYESHGDYSDGNGTRIYDSRNTGYYFKAGYGFRKAHWESNNAYNFSFNQYGFILDSQNNNAVQDARWSRAMTGPHHNVLLNIFSSQNTFYLNGHDNTQAVDTRGSVLKINAGVQSNKRAEDEGGGEISLNMHLLSLLQSARWEKYLSGHILLVLNQQTTYELNTNYGKRIIIPDAHMLEENASAFIRRYAGKLILEGGIGATYKQITTLQTGSFNAPGKMIAPFSSDKPAANGMLGLSYSPNRAINMKANVATGVRTGNLAELASEGLHEGSFRYEIGDPSLKPEQNINTDITLEISKRRWFLSASAFYNYFNNYIYLTPTTDSFDGIFQIFRYVQQDARLYGGELVAIYKPDETFQVKETFSAVEGETAHSGYLPFIPAWRSISAVRYEHDLSDKIKSFYCEPELEYVLAQNKPAQFESATAAYALVHVHAGFSTYLHKHGYSCALSVRNLLNQAYADHLSRLKYYGINNQGINVILSINTQLSW
jgi:iron complex outermembrane receptor protein